MAKMRDEWVIHYDELPVTIVGGKHYSGSWYEPDYYDEYEDEIQYDYKIDYVDLIDFLYSKQSVWTYLWQKLHPEMSIKQFIDWVRDTDEGDQAADQAINDNIDEIYKEHEQEILKHFEDAARDEFESSDYDYTDYVYTGPDSDDYYQDYIDRQFEGYNPIEEAKKKARKQSKGMSRFCPPGNRKDKNITVKTDAGDVEKSIEFFNNAMDVDTGEAVGEGLSDFDKVKNQTSSNDTVENKGIRGFDGVVNDIQFYETENGGCPTQEFLMKLRKDNSKLYEKVFRDLVKLAVDDDTRPGNTRPIDNGIFELKTQQGNNISRAFFFFVLGRRVIITNGYVKKQQELDVTEFEKAVKYMKDYLRRFSGGK